MSEHPLNETEIQDKVQHPQRMLSENKRIALLFLISVAVFFILRPLTSNSYDVSDVIADLGLLTAIMSIAVWIIAQFIKADRPKPATDFTLAVGRMNRWKRRRLEVGVWVLIFVVSLVANVYLRLDGAWVLPLIPIAAFFMFVFRLIQLFTDEPNRKFVPTTVQDEMQWLFGDDWSITTGPSEFIFAKDRLRKRRIAPWLFAGHMLIALPFLAITIMLLISMVQFSEDTGAAMLILGVLVWLSAAAIPHFHHTFPSRARLEQRERRLGEALRLEQQRMYPEAQEKAKRKRYAIGDDGELVEIEDDL